MQQRKLRLERSDGFRSRGMPSIAENHQKLGERCGKNSLSEPPVETNLTDTLSLEF